MFEFWFLVCYAVTQAALQLHEELIKMGFSFFFGCDATDHTPSPPITPGTHTSGA